MKISNKYRITNKVSYRVLYSDMVDDDPECVGGFYPDTKEIVLKNGLTEEQLLYALVHELLHCFEHEYKFKIPHVLIYKLEKPIVKFLFLNNHDDA